MAAELLLSWPPGATVGWGVERPGPPESDVGVETLATAPVRSISGRARSRDAAADLPGSASPIPNQSLRPACSASADGRTKMFWSSLSLRARTGEPIASVPAVSGASLDDDVIALRWPGAAYNVPRSGTFADELPETSTGVIMRRALSSSGREADPV